MTDSAAIRERPIIFSGPMVKAILEGRKTQTRRVLKKRGQYTTRKEARCPYGQPGDRLWVRETFMAHSGSWRYLASSGFFDSWFGQKWTPSIHMPRGASRILLEITGVRVERLQEITEEDAKAEGVPLLIQKMKVTDTKFVDGKLGVFGKIEEATYRGPFRDLWDKLNEKRGFGWRRDPWVWVLTFKMLGPRPAS